MNNQLNGQFHLPQHEVSRQDMLDKVLIESGLWMGSIFEPSEVNTISESTSSVSNVKFSECLNESFTEDLSQSQPSSKDSSHKQLDLFLEELKIMEPDLDFLPDPLSRPNLALNLSCAQDISPNVNTVSNIETSVSGATLYPDLLHVPGKLNYIYIQQTNRNVLII